MSAPAGARSAPEFSAQALLLGLLIGTVLTAANTYLGLYAGMTVSGSIPAAIVSMGVLRGILRRGSILENNIVQTMASAGESVAAGIIFTVPAMLITGVWSGFNYWQVTMIGALGGVLGVLLMIPLRRTLIVESKELVYPEGVACAQVLEAGEEGGSSLARIAAALAGGLVFKACIGLFAIFRGTVEYAWRMGNSLLYMGSDVSVALLGVGVIVGIEIGVQVVGGSLIAWGLAIPIYYLSHPLPEGSALDAAWAAWSGQIRYMGVGAMIVGGLASMWKIRSGIKRVLGQLRGGLQTSSGADRDIPLPASALIFAAAACGTFILYRAVTGSFSIALAAGLAMLIAAFFFVAVASYICGLVGSSNNPVSGMTICALMFSAAVLLLLGMTGAGGILGALGVAGVVCCAAATAGDTSQDLKTGHLVGAAPRKQQIAQFIGVLVPALAIAPVLTLLHNAYGIGTDAPGALRAPQATLFASIAEAMFGSTDLPWNMVWIGAGIAVGILALDAFLERLGSRFRAHVMPVAVGIYLPLSLMVPIFLGGVVSTLLKRKPQGALHNGVLIGSGLIAGEAIAGILIAVPRTLPQFADMPIPVPVFDSLGLSVLALAAAMWAIYRASVAGGGAASQR